MLCNKGLIIWPLYKGAYFQFEFWGVKKNLIPYMWQIVFVNVLVKGWIVDPYAY